jgi:hypothetical protein
MFKQKKNSFFGHEGPEGKQAINKNKIKKQPEHTTKS